MIYFLFSNRQLHENHIRGLRTGKDKYTTGRLRLKLRSSLFLCNRGGSPECESHQKIFIASLSSPKGPAVQFARTFYCDNIRVINV